MLDLSGTAPLEVPLVAIAGEAYRVPEADRGLHAQLVLESPERGVGVQGPIAPCGPGEAVLKEHADDRHHRQAAIGNLDVQPPGVRVGITVVDQWWLVAEPGAVPGEAGGVLTGKAVGNDLSPANLLRRPCLTSVARRRLKFASLPSRVKPTGSQKPTGACTPSSSSKALSGESVYRAQSPHADPVRPSWKNIPMIAIIARRPLAISAFNFFFLVSLSAIGPVAFGTPNTPPF